MQTLKQLEARIRKLEANGTFKCPECGSKVLNNTKYCVKCKKKVEGSKVLAMAHEAVIEQFLERHAGYSDNLKSTGKQLINYKTTLAEWDNSVLHVNMTKYSSSTSKIQRRLQEAVKAFGKKRKFIVKEHNDLPMGVTKLS